MALEPLLYNIGLVIAVAAFFAVLVRFIKQPLILGYVIAGVIIGPQVLKLIVDIPLIESLSMLGIAFLLFIIGMELDVKKFKKIGISIIIIGVLQVLFTTLAGFLVAQLLHFSILVSVYIGLIVSFSSTMIVIKLLSDNKEIDSIHGQLITGILLVQDVLAVLALSSLSIINKDGISLVGIGFVLLKGIALFIVAFLFVKYLIPFFLKFISDSKELLLICSLTICFALAGIAYLFGYSLAIGAFIAGISLGATPFVYEIIGQIKPLRDFFAIMFFVAIGMSLSFVGVETMIIPFILLLAVIIIAKPLIIFLCVRMFKYSSRTSFFTGTSLAQSSEFSLILAAQGLALAHITESTATLTIALTLVTILLTAYIMKYDERIYEMFTKVHKKKNHNGYELSNVPKEIRSHVVIFGTHRLGMYMINFLNKMKKKFIVVDFNPERVRQLMKKKVRCICSDMMNPEVYEHINLKHASIIISTINNYSANQYLLGQVKEVNKKAVVILTSRSTQDAIDLYKKGASYVVVPDSLGGEKVTNYMVHLGNEGIKNWGKKHYKLLVYEEKNPFIPTRHFE